MVLDPETRELKQFMPKVLETVLAKIGQLLAAPEVARGAHKDLQRLKHMVNGVAAELHS